MLWSEFVSGLDAVRVEVRSTKNLKHEAPAQDLLLDKVLCLVDQVKSTVQPVAEKVDPIDERLLWVSDDPQPEPPHIVQPVEIVDRGEGEGRMLVMPRETKRVSRPAMLEEVFDEKELGK